MQSSIVDSDNRALDAFIGVGDSQVASVDF